MDITNFWNATSPWILDHGVKIAVILVIAYIIIKISVRVVTKAVRSAVKGQPFLAKDAEKKREDTLIQIINGTLKVIIWLFAILMSLAEAGVNIGPLIAGAGVFGIAVGFGGQYLIRDLISGLFIILENQYRIGDVVEIADKKGVVEDISLRVTIMRDLDGILYHIPHGEVTTVSNYSKGVSKINFNVGIGYGANIDKAIEVINKVGEELSKDEEFGPLIKEAPNFLRVDNLGDSSVDLKIVGVTEPAKQFAVMGELRKRIKEAFDKNGIEIPFPQMVVHKG